MIIRKAELKDVKQCEEISNIKEFKMPNGDVPEAKYFEQSLNNIFFVAEEEKKILGLILGTKLTKEFVYLDTLTVRKEARGKKIGEKLLNVFRDELKKQKVKQYFLIAPSFNEKTLNFYRKNGLLEGKQYTLFCEDL
jgi:ribosomal protein S18 acetylase RimI-like enzyme